MTPPEPSAIVTIASNGYTVQSPDAPLVVCEDDDSEKGACLATARMLYAVLEAVGAYGSKHDAFRVRVSVIDRETGEDVIA